MLDPDVPIELWHVNTGAAAGVPGCTGACQIALPG